MGEYPDIIKGELELEELLSRPSADTIKLFNELDGDVIFLGIAGKIGPSLASMARRACDESGISKRIIGVSRFRDLEEKQKIESFGIETIQGDLLDLAFLESLPKVKNVYFLAGMKFGSLDNLSQTWAVNTYLPALVAGQFKNSRIVAYSTGCIYPLVSLASGGSVESDNPDPVGEYAQSCLGRERMFEYGSVQYKTPATIIRLNYAVELRYGVLVDIGLKVKNNIPIDLEMGHFNVIWQGDANEIVLRSISRASSPPYVLNVTGTEILSVREVALQFGKLFNKKVNFTGKEASTALLSNPARSNHDFGQPKVPIERVVLWIANWLEGNNKLLGKPTHFEVRDGKY